MLAALVGGAGAVEVDLPLELGDVEDRPLDDVRVVRRERVLDRGDVRDGAAHADEGVGTGAVVELREVGGDRVERGGERVLVDRAVQPEALGEAHRADVDAEPLVDPVAAAECELRATAAGVEDDQRPVAEADAGLHREVCEPALLLAGDDLDLDPCALAHGVEERRRCSRRSAARLCRRPRSPRRPRVSPRRPSPAIASTVRAIGSSWRSPAVVQPLPEPRDLGAVDDRRPRAVLRFARRRGT